jgi:S1-C subfamily serine protease
MYANGQGVPQDHREAVNWYRKAAEQGHASAQLNLGVMYDNGQGVPQDHREAVNWYRKTAEQGDARAQYNLGLMYAKGQGVSKDYQLAYFWGLLASTQGDRSALTLRDVVERQLSPEQRATAQAAARNWQPKTAAQADAPPNARAGGEGGFTPAPSRITPSSAQADTTGSGFRVARGAIVTNHHVIESCSRLRVNGVAAQVRGSDARSDLALLNVSLPGPSTRLRAQRAAVGEPVAVAGYPLRGLLSGFNMTTGNLSSLSGIGGDTRLVQITAPVQPGNSGGPVLDSAGNLMGVVVSKLDAVKAAKLTGDIPQNVNFAINVNVLRSFLDANSVDYDTASSDKALPSTAIADRAKGFTVLVECWK